MSYLVQFIQECHDNLLSSNNEANKALEYLQKRNLKTETIKTHQIGYCYKKQVLSDGIKYYGKDDKDIEGSDNGYGYFINGRIIVPIYSEFGIAVGIATRKPSFEPGNTWWNLPKPFKKGEYLFLLDKTRKDIFADNKVTLVEGYIDAIILRQEGLKSVVAIMGTTLSARKAGLIARYCDNICLCLDVDANMAGQKGQSKAIYVLKEFDFYNSISVIEDLPVGEDPDIFVANNGLDALLSKERPLSSKEINKIWKRARDEMKR